MYRHADTHTYMHTQKKIQVGLEKNEVDYWCEKSLDFKESREDNCRRERGRLFHEDGPKTEREREPNWKAWTGESGGWKCPRGRAEGALCTEMDCSPGLQNLCRSSPLPPPSWKSASQICPGGETNKTTTQLVPPVTSAEY